MQRVILTMLYNYDNNKKSYNKKSYNNKKSYLSFFSLISALFFSLSLFSSCTGVINTVDPDGGTSDDGGTTEDALAEDVEVTPDTSTDPCDGIDCGVHGSCIVAGESPVCDCDEGYRPEGLSCVEEDPIDPCEGVTCGSNAHCDDGLCVCDEGYEGNPETGCTSILTEEEMARTELIDIARAELGYCEGTDDRPYMQWQPGLWCYDFVAWVYDECSYSLPSPLSLPKYYINDLPAGWHPKPGDLIKFNIQHYGMVEDVSPDGETIYTIEGNVNSCVTTRTVSQSSLEYYGYLESYF